MVHLSQVAQLQNAFGLWVFRHCYDYNIQNSALIRTVLDLSFKFEQSSTAGTAEVVQRLAKVV